MRNSKKLLVELRSVLESAEDQIDRDGEAFRRYEDAADKAYRADVLRIVRAAIAKAK